MRRANRGRALADCRRHALRRTMTNVADREYTGDA
jgi:hypothetical protein